MRILFVVPYVPNLVRVRPYNLIRHLAERGNQVSVMTLWSNEAEQQSASALNDVCEQVTALRLPKWRSYLNCLTALPTRVPLQAVYCWQPALAEQISGAVGQRREGGLPAFDVIHVEHLRGAHFGLDLKKKLPGGQHPPIVWDSVDCISHLFRQSSSKSKKRLSRWMTRFELSRTERYEGWLAGQFDRVLVTSSADREALLALRAGQQPPAPVTVLPNGVDLSYFTPGNPQDRQPNTLVISGKMSYHANVSMVLFFANKILPFIWSSRPDVKLLVVGQDPPREVMALAQNPNITVTGTVRDLRPYLRQASVAVAPLTYGAGIQNKVLEAMACGTPVVTTERAVGALEVTNGRDLLVGRDEKEFSEHVLRLINNPELGGKIGQAARKYVEAHHHWADIAAQLEAIYTEAICANGR